jgi:hypothetical protein
MLFVSSHMHSIGPVGTTRVAYGRPAGPPFRSQAGAGTAGGAR